MARKVRKAASSRKKKEAKRPPRGAWFKLHDLTDSIVIETPRGTMAIDLTATGINVRAIDTNNGNKWVNALWIRPNCSNSVDLSFSPIKEVCR